MLSSASNLLRGLDVKLIPKPLKVLDQWLVRHWPLLWRSRLLWACWIALLLALLGVLIGSLAPTSAKNVWGMSQINLLHSLFQLAGVMAIGFWGYLQWRVPIGDISQLKQLRLALYSSLAVAVLILQPSGFLFTATYQTSKAMSWSEISDEYQYHQAYDFWYCSDKLPDALTASQAQRVGSLLDRFGMNTTGKIHLTDNDGEIFVDEKFVSICDHDQRVLDIRDSLGSFNSALFNDKFISIYSSHFLWEEPLGLVFGNGLSWVKNSAFWMLMVIVFWVVGQQEIRLRQFQSFTGISFKLFDQGLPVPEWLTRQDQRLLRNRPIMWASRTHFFVYHGLLFGFIGSAVVALLFHSLFESNFEDVMKSIFGSGSVFEALLILTFPILMPALWAVARKHYPVVVSAPMDTFNIVQKYLSVTLVIALLFVFMGLLSGMYPTNNLGAYILLGVNSSAIVLSLTLISDTSGWRCLVAALITYCVIIVGSVLFVRPIVATSISVYGYIASQIISIFLLLAWVRMTSSVIASIIALAAIPATFFWPALFLGQMMSEFLGIREYLGVCLLSLLIFPLYLHFLQPAIHNLVKAAYQPKSE